jgi:uroporphyrin-III C-methyltransferase/precorrin-2 dehydrogenase/sirohydrochlorin ferrochelatase
MAPLARLPVFLALEGKRAVIAGGTAAAAWKVELLSAAGARVEVYAETPSDELLQVAGDPPRGAIAVQRRGWTADDLKGAAVAIGAFEDDDASAAFAAAARDLGVPVNVIDKPAFCDFAFGAIVNRSPLVIGISTDGAAPVFAQAIRAKLEALLPKGFADWAAAAARWRVALKTSGLPFSGRRKFWQLFTAHAIRNPDSEPAQNDFERFVAEVQGLGSAVENGSVILVGAGPGDPELLTLRAVRALQSADVILFDDLVSRDVLDFARREARKMLVGKTGFGPSCKQDDINALMVSLAKQGKRVVRLKGGDPLIFGRAAEEIAACRAANIAVDVVPGITAAQGGGPRLAERCRPGHDHRDLHAGPHIGCAGREGHRRRARPADAGAGNRQRHAGESDRGFSPDPRIARAACAGRVAGPGTGHAGTGVRRIRRREIKRAARGSESQLTSPAQRML